MARKAERFIPLQPEQEITERAAVGMLQLILNDSLAVMKSEEYHPDARLFAQRIAYNVVTWNAVTGPLQ